MQHRDLNQTLETAIAAVAQAASDLQEAAARYGLLRKAYDVREAQEFMKAKAEKRDDGRYHTDEEAKRMAIIAIGEDHGATKAAEIVFETAKLVLKSRQDELSGWQTRVRREIEADKVEAFSNHNGR